MSTVEAANTLQAFTKALQGMVLGMILAYAGLLVIDTGAVKFGFVFLPLISIVLWPTRASRSWSMVGVFFIGLFYDLISGGPLGLWALCYLVLFFIIGESIRSGLGFLKSFWWYIFSIGITIGLLFVFGRLFLGIWPRWQELVTDAFASVLVFPLVFWARSFVRAFSPDHSISRTAP